MTDGKPTICAYISVVTDGFFLHDTTQAELLGIRHFERCVGWKKGKGSSQLYLEPVDTIIFKNQNDEIIKAPLL